tara:strand:- start:64 stop:1041 length:978 start_codon:yes stop_codon:yes gene_type:complete
MGFFKNLQGSTAAPRFQNQQFGEVERIQPMPAPPQPMQPRPSLVVGGPAFFTPEGYQAPVQPEQAFMPTDRRPDPIGDSFSRPYERPIMPMPMPRPIDVPQDRAPVVPIEQPRETLPVDPGPITTQPVMPMPEPTPQSKYDPFAYSDLGRRALGGEYINSMTFHYFDPTTGKSGSTNQGYSRVPDSAKPYIYLNKDEAEKAKEKFLTYQDTGGAETPAPRTPVTAPAPTEAPMPAPMKPLANTGAPGSGSFTLPDGQTIQIPFIDLPNPNINSELRDNPMDRTMPSMPSLPSRLMGMNIPLPTLPTLGSRPSLTRPIMGVNPRER